MLRALLAAALLAWALGDFAEECAPGESGEGGCSSRGSALVKNAILDSVIESVQEEDEGGFPATTWVAEPFGDCVENCGPKKFRKVECRSVFDGKAAAEDSCKGTKPATFQECVCGGLEVCVKGEGACPAAEKGPRDPQTFFDQVGCFAAPKQAGSTDNVEDYMDMTCAKWAAQEPCMSGLPFYSYTDPSMSAAKCATFCTGKGMDIFGLEKEKTCRCGASVLNEEVWHEATPHPGLLFEPSRLEAAQEGCPLRVFRYAGFYESGGIPDELCFFREGDLEYVDTIALGRDVDEEAEEDGLPPDEMEKGPSAEGAPQEAPAEQGQAAFGQLATNATAEPSFKRPCWPGNCGPGRGQWKTRSETPLPGVGGDYEEYAIVDYGFIPGTDSKRKEAFRKAVLVIADVSCINLRELPHPPSGFGITVGKVKEDSCYVSGMGWGKTTLNLGWCKDRRHVGNMVHELGHAIGMNHEQKRPEASLSYHGHGPFLKLRWENIPDHWLPQFVPDMRSYTGSTEEGPGDGTAGWAPYDFGSIMHYPAVGPRGKFFDTIPASSKHLTGSRKALSKGDIEQINDMYHCVHKTRGPQEAPPNSFSCERSSDCDRSMYCENSFCVPKKADNQETDDYSKCQSGKGVCGRCAASNNRVNGPYRCSVDKDCDGGLKCGNWWQNCWGCRCQCFRR